MDHRRSNRNPSRYEQPARPGSWRSGIYTQQRGSRPVFSGRRLRRFPLGTLALAALCVALVLVVVLAGRAAVQDTLRWKLESSSPGAGAAVSSLERGESAPSSTPKERWREGELPYLFQKDPQWAEQRYAGSTVGESGCGPTCMSMVYIALTGRRSMDPGTMASLAQNGGFVEDGKTSWRFMTEGAAQLGLSSREVPYEEQQIRQLLGEGTPIICSMMPGDFTDTGHFIVLCGVNKDGLVLLRDPNSEERSAQGWELGRIMPQMANLWAFSRSRVG